MKYAHQCLVTAVSLFAISAMLTVPVPAGAGEIHGQQTGQNVSLGSGSFASNTSGKIQHRAWSPGTAPEYHWAKKHRRRPNCLKAQHQGL